MQFILFHIYMQTHNYGEIHIDANSYNNINHTFKIMQATNQYNNEVDISNVFDNRGDTLYKYSHITKNEVNDS